MHMHACFQLSLSCLTSHEHRRSTLTQRAISSLKSFCTVVFIMMSLCRNSVVVDRVTEQAKLAHEWSYDMTTANIAEVLKLAAKPVQYDNDEKTWLEFRFKLKNYLTLVDERYVALLLNAGSEPVANLPTGTEESAVT